jgi:hypothetical protein
MSLTIQTSNVLDGQSYRNAPFDAKINAQIAMTSADENGVRFVSLVPSKQTNNSRIPLMGELTGNSRSSSPTFCAMRSAFRGTASGPASVANQSCVTNPRRNQVLKTSSSVRNPLKSHKETAYGGVFRPPINWEEPNPSIT